MQFSPRDSGGMVVFNKGRREKTAGK